MGLIGAAGLGEGIETGACVVVSFVPVPNFPLLDKKPIMDRRVEGFFFSLLGRELGM